MSRSVRTYNGIIGHSIHKTESLYLQDCKIPSFQAFKKHMYVTTPDDLKRFELEISGIFQREREKVIVQANLCAAVWKARQLELEKVRQ